MTFVLEPAEIILVLFVWRILSLIPKILIHLELCRHYRCYYCIKVYRNTSKGDQSELGNICVLS